MDENNKPVCFVVMPISDVHGYDSGHFGRVYEHLLKPAIVEAGFLPIRADDTNKTDYIVVGIIQRMVDSAMVLCDYSAKNSNVMYELGIRHAFNKPVTLIKDKRTEKVFDIQGLRHYEYDDSLRIDSVQTDIKKIAKALKETAEADTTSFNSVVQLAGLKAAEVPEGQKVSADTQLLLAAIKALEGRIEVNESKHRKDQRFFVIEGTKVNFGDGSSADIGDQIYSNGQLVGTLIDIHPAEEKIFIRQHDGRIVPYHASSIKSRALEVLPF